MPFPWFVALRYLRDARGQTALILSAVAVGVSVIVFLSALINGLQASLIAKTLGSQPHVTVRAPREESRAIVEPTAERAVARRIEERPQRLRSIDQWPAIATTLARAPGVTAVSPAITGAGFAVRGDATAPIVVRGVDAERYRAILDVAARIVDGRYTLDSSDVVIGQKLATDLGVAIGDKLRITSTEGVTDVVTVQGTFALGNEAVDGTWVLCSLRLAQALYALPGGATALELKVAEVFDAERVAAEVRDRTGLRADSWMAINAELLAGLSAQSSSKGMIQFFVIVAVALGIASVLIVSVVQKSREIGILRAVGTPANRILAVFLIQGGVLGAGGAVVGCAIGAALGRLFETFVRDPSGAPKFPIDLGASTFLSASALAIGVGLLSAYIPARRAANLDPATAIRNG